MACHVSLHNACARPITADLICLHVVDVTNVYKKGEPLMYSIKCPKPSPIHFDYSVSTALKVEWKGDGHSWIREGDYFNDTSHHVKIEEGKNVYKKDIEVIKY